MKKLVLIFLLLMLMAAGIRFWLMPKMGAWLVEDSGPQKADVIVVLATGAAYYPRAIEAARLWQEGYAGKVVVNGDRKTDALRALEAQGYAALTPFPAGITHLYEFLGVPAASLQAVALPDVFDTVSEAQGLWDSWGEAKPQRILLVTSRFHTHRAARIWRGVTGEQVEIVPVAARSDPFNPDAWWQNARQIRWLMAEYGGWVSLLWRELDQ